MPTVLVTGAGRGIGRATALRLAASGWDVIAGARRPDDAPAGMRSVTLDVTNAEQVAALPEAVGPLDALVNNAGIVVSGPVEALSVDDLRHQLDVNIVGQVAVTQALLPALRESGGRIVFISSVSGRVASPFMGAYAASKFGLEGMADALRVELRPWDIDVVLVEPGSIDTDLWRKADATVDEVEAALSPAHRELYGKQVAGMRKVIARIAKGAAPADTVSATVEQALTNKRPKPRYLVGKDAKAQTAVAGALPTRAFDAILGKMTGG